MTWTIEYYEQEDSTQPSEVFEDALDRTHPRLAGKLARIAVALQTYGHRLGGGLVEPCRGYAGLWEIRAIHNQWLGREFFGFDEARIVLLHGYVKRGGQAAAKRDLERAFSHWTAYLRTRAISPPQPPQEESDEPI